MQPYTIEADLTLHRLPAMTLPDWSPDGRHLAYTLRQMGRVRSTQRHGGLSRGMRVWLVDTGADGPPVPVGPSDADTWGPAWSSDGRSLAYCSTHAGTSVVLRVKSLVDGSERQITLGQAGFSGQPWQTPVWAPDLRALVCWSSRPLAPARQTPKVWSSDPAPGATEPDDPPPPETTGVLGLCDLATDHVQPLSGVGHPIWAGWRGQDLLAADYLGQFRWGEHRADLLRLDPGGGPAVKLARAVPFCPDMVGCRYFVVTARGLAGIKPNGQVWRMDPAANAVRDLTAEGAADPRRPLLHRGDGLYFSGGGRVWRLRGNSTPESFSRPDVPIAECLHIDDDGVVARTQEGAFLQLRERGSSVAVWMAPAGVRAAAAAFSRRRLAVVVESGAMPPELYIVIGGRPRVVGINRALADTDLAAPVVLRDDRGPVGMLSLPRAGAKQALPMVFSVYGGHLASQSMPTFDGGQPALESLQVLCGAGYAVLRCDVPMDPAVEPSDAIVTAVTRAATCAVDQGIADPERLAVVGHSYGAYSVNCLITRTRLFRAAVSWSGPADLATYTLAAEEDGRTAWGRAWGEEGQGRMGGTLWERPARYRYNSPLYHLDQVETPLLLLVGDHAPRHEAWQAELMFAGLKRLQHPVTMVTYAGEGHVFSHADHVRDAWTRVLAWLGRWLVSPQV